MVLNAIVVVVIVVVAVWKVQWRQLVSAIIITIVHKSVGRRRQNSGFELPRTLPRGDAIPLNHWAAFVIRACGGVSRTGTLALPIGLRQLVREPG